MRLVRAAMDFVDDAIAAAGVDAVGSAPILGKDMMNIDFVIEKKDICMYIPLKPARPFRTKEAT